MNNFIGNIKKLGTANNSLRSLLAVLLLICGTHNAMALGVCDYPATFGKLTLNQEIADTGNLPVGAVLGGYSMSQRYTLANSCTGDYRQYTTGTFPVYDSTTYKSGVTGVGIRVLINNELVPTNNNIKNLSGDGSTPIVIRKVEVNFVKTGDIVPGSVTPGKLTQVSFEDSAGTKEVFSVEIGTVVVKARSCEITGSSAIPVPMGVAQKEDFGGINSTLTPVNVQIPLQCHTDTTVNIKFDALSSLGNGIIDLAEGGAEGVGIQLKMNDKPVEFDTKTFVTKTTKEGTFNIPLTAAYIRTDQVIKAGEAKAVANFTITYE
ncbi:fimbrial protein [Rahnella victoriana]|uniref:fimbrial protein n=1 Tax=Rahnella victoriana TaxID=1510570 RepID=UPI001E4A7A61|nr:fimbrial protein [Rahnella victoriana]UHM91708.1 fimbrial protein [Rahnella victoriana]